MKQTITITGHIPVKKNSYRISRNGGVYKPESVTDYETTVAQDVLVQRIRNMDEAIAASDTFEVQFLFLIGGKMRDTDGLVTTVLDALQDAGVFTDDKCVNKITAYRHYKKERKPKEEEARVTLIAQK